MSEPQSKKTVSASRTLIKRKRKNFEDESASCVFSFSTVKTCFLLHGRESRASFFLSLLFFYRRMFSCLKFSFKLASPFHSFCSTKSLWEEVIQTKFALYSVSTGVSRRQQDKVVVDIDHWHVEGRHFVDTEGFVHCWVQLLDLQLPLHPLHCVQGCCLVLLPHQQTCLGEEKPSINPLGIYTRLWYKAFKWKHNSDIYLHAVIFIIHILDPGNELTSIEAISHRFVLITLRTYTSYNVD